MTIINKVQVAENFGRAALSYDKHARVQKAMACELLEKILATNMSYSRILEIGCGTGYLTELLAEKFPQAAILATDISPQMVGAAKRQLSNYDNVAYLVADGEQLPVEGPFDLIVSSAVFQWFASYQEPFSAYWQLLRSGGMFIFSTLGESTFCELRSALKDQGIEQDKSPFITRNELDRVLKQCGFQASESERQFLKDYCPSARELLIGIKKIGAHEMGFSLKGGEIFKLTGYYHAKFSLLNQVYATYEVLYGQACKYGEHTFRR